MIIGSYNAGTGPERGLSRSAYLRQRDLEVRSLIEHYQLDALALQEVQGPLAEVPGMDLAHDTSNESRGNIALYARTSLGLGRPVWLDLETTWPRTDHDGTHPARSYLRRRVGGVQIIAAHQPPPHIPNVIPAQLEGIDALTRVMAPWTRRTWRLRGPESRRRALALPRVVLWDANRSPQAAGTLPGPRMLAQRLTNGAPGLVYGRGIDCAVGRNVVAVPHYVTAVPMARGLVELGSDHKHALILTLA